MSVDAWGDAMFRQRGPQRVFRLGDADHCAHMVAWYAQGVGEAYDQLCHPRVKQDPVQWRRWEERFFWMWRKLRDYELLSED